MKKRKICITITTRGNYAKLKGVMRLIQERDDLELQVILAGGIVLQRYGMGAGDFIDKEFSVDRFIHFMVEGENPLAMAKSSGLALIEFSTAFEDLAPDVVMVLADRFECLPIAMAATYMNIPIVHVEGGEVSGSIDESVRHAITKMAHLHFPATKDAAVRIERMGEEPKAIHSVGGTSLDILAELDLDDLSPLMGLQETTGVGPILDLKNDPYLLIIQHPVTTEYDENLYNVSQTLDAVYELGMNGIWIWPNMDAGSDGISKGVRMFREKSHDAQIHFFKSLPIQFYAPLLKNAACFVGNSSSGIRESAFLGTPTVNIGNRQQGRERGRNTVDVTYDRTEIIEAIKQQVSHGSYDFDYTYGDGKACHKLVDILAKFDFSIQKQITY